MEEKQSTYKPSSQTGDSAITIPRVGVELERLHIRRGCGEGVDEAVRERGELVVAEVDFADPWQAHRRRHSTQLVICQNQRLQ